MRSFEIEYPLDVLTADPALVASYKVKDKVMNHFKGEKK